MSKNEQVTKNVNVILHTCALPPLSPYVLHYDPMDASKNGEPVFKFRYGLPGQDWREPEPSDPLSVVDQVGTKYFIGKNLAEVGEFDKKVWSYIAGISLLPIFTMSPFEYFLIPFMFKVVSSFFHSG